MTAMNLNRAIRGPVTAVPVVAGKGVRFVQDVENNRVVVEADETVLWEGSQVMSSTNQIELSESATNFETVVIYGKLADSWFVSELFRFNPSSTVTQSSMSVSHIGANGDAVRINTCYLINSPANKISVSAPRQFSLTTSGISRTNTPDTILTKIVGINRISST